jgi:hypothetical protein
LNGTQAYEDQTAPAGVPGSTQCCAPVDHRTHHQARLRLRTATGRGERLELSSTDGEAALRVSVVTLATEKPGKALLAADRLFQIVRELDDVEIVLESDERGCTLRGHGSEFKLFVQNPEDFPPVPEFEGEPDLTLSGMELKRMISLTAYAAARETSRYAINGVQWDKTGKKMFMVATDGRRLREPAAAWSRPKVAISIDHPQQGPDRVRSRFSSAQGWQFLVD